MRAMRTCGIGVVCLALLGAIFPSCSGSPDLGTPVDVSAVDPFTQALVYARAGDAVKLEAILAANDELIYQRSSDGMSLLHYAAISSQPATVKLLLDKGADTMALNDEDRTPREAAEAERANEAVLQLLRDAEGL